jgi:vacuolar-type H+-ATPase subunit E/Vma4
MDVELGKLIETLKEKGVEEGRRIGRGEIEEAAKEAAAMLEKVRQQSAGIVLEAEKRAGEFASNGERAVRQAARDTLLLLKNQVQSLFDRVFKAEISAALDPALVGEMILRIVDGWVDKTGAEIVLGQKDKETVERMIASGVKKEIQSGLVLRINPSDDHGFRFALKGEDVYYDFTDESLAIALKSLLNPQLRELVDGKEE